SSLTDAMWRDQGTIYLFNTTNGDVRLLRGHRGPVLALGFTPTDVRWPNKAPLLLSAGRERDTTANKYAGAVRLWKLPEKNDEEPLATRVDLPDPAELPPGVAAWHTGPGARQVRVALAWQKGNLSVWDADTNRPFAPNTKEGTFNDTVAYLAGN